MGSHGTLEEDEEWMDNLHFIHSDIDPATVKPIDPRQLASLVNEFLLRSADILNKFCAQFERRLMELDFRLDSFERMVTLMERKLGNINIDEVKKPPEEKETATDGKAKKSEETPGEAEGEKGTDQRQGKETAEGTTNAKEHPTVAKYFKMLKMGVPEAAVRQKMRSEGVDDALLNDPEKQMQLPPSKHGVPTNRDSLVEEDESSSSSEE